MATSTEKRTKRKAERSYRRKKSSGSFLLSRISRLSAKCTWSFRRGLLSRLFCRGDKTEQSLRLLISGGTDYELRTTCVEEFHGEEEVRAMGLWAECLVPGAKPGKWYLQRFVDRDSVLQYGLHAPSREKMGKMQKALEPHGVSVFLRGLD